MVKKNKKFRRTRKKKGGWFWEDWGKKEDVEEEDANKEDSARPARRACKGTYEEKKACREKDAIADNIDQGPPKLKLEDKVECPFCRKEILFKDSDNHISTAHWEYNLGGGLRQRRRRKRKTRKKKKRKRKRRKKTRKRRR